MKGKVTKKVQQVNKSIDRLSDVIFPDLSSKSPSKSPTKQPLSSSSSSTTSIPSISTDNRYQVFDNMDTMFKGASTVEAKLDIIMATLVEALQENRKYKEEIKQLTIKVNTLEKDNKIIKKELRQVKESANRYELSARSLTVRILGLPVSQEEANSSERNKVASRTRTTSSSNPFSTQPEPRDTSLLSRSSPPPSRRASGSTPTPRTRGAFLTLPLFSSSSQTRPTEQPSFSAKGRFWPISRRRVAPFPSSWRT
jgi:hypothetical protein